MNITIDGIEIECDKIKLIHGVNEIHVGGRSDGTYGVSILKNDNLIGLEVLDYFPSNLIQETLKQ